MVRVRRRGEDEVPAEWSPLSKRSYVDFFTATSTRELQGTPEEWARRVIEGAAGWGGQFIWRGPLRLQLSWIPSRDTVGGWKIAARTEQWIRVEARSGFLTAHLVVHVSQETLSVATLLNYEKSAGRRVWQSLAPIHRRAMPGLLRSAVRASQPEPS
jgi:hypothetical protein